MLRLFDPTLDQQGTPQEEQLNLIPIYRNPKIQGAFLPGNLFIFFMFMLDWLDWLILDFTL